MTLFQNQPAKLSNSGALSLDSVLAVNRANSDLQGLTQK